MTLRGITRAIAHNIIEYRKQIGGFKHVEDLALVCGIGATKLEKIRPEIHVSFRRPAADTSNPHHQHRRSSSSVSGSVKSHQKVMVNINTANPDMLSAIPEVSLEMAQRIVDYRSGHGPYSHINDIVEPANVVDIQTLLKIKTYITVGNQQQQPATRGHHSRNSSSVSSRLINNTSINVFSPENLCSFRPKTVPFDGLRNGLPVFRVATWNFQECSLEKIQNPGVREVICMTVLENSVQIIAVQDLVHQESLMLIANELNSPSLPNVQKCKNNSSKWKYLCSPKLCTAAEQDDEDLVQYCGFLWDTSANISNSGSGVIELPPQNGTEAPEKVFQAVFTVSLCDWLIFSNIK